MAGFFVPFSSIWTGKELRNKFILFVDIPSIYRRCAILILNNPAHLVVTLHIQYNNNFYLMDQTQLFVKMALLGWDTQLKRATDLLNILTDDQLKGEISPGKNSGVYLVGHLVAYHDLLSETLGLGKKAYPDSLKVAFLQNPDKSGLPVPSIEELRQFWQSVHQRLNEAFKSVPAGDWLQRHEAMSDEDFQKDPSRNKLSVLLNRTNHLAYHLGQLRMLK